MTLNEALLARYKAQSPEKYIRKYGDKSPAEVMGTAPSPSPPSPDDTKVKRNLTKKGTIEVPMVVKKKRVSMVKKVTEK